MSKTYISVALRQLVRDRAQTACEYCLMPEMANRWTEHFQLKAGEVSPLTAIGRVTVRLLQLNRPERVAERRLLFEAKLLKLPE